MVVSNGAGSITSRSAQLAVTGAITQGSDVLTYKNDVARTGQNLAEKILTPANVSSGSFGKLRFLKTDGKVDAQPLYLSALSVGGTANNVVFVATANDSVYAFDADNGAAVEGLARARGREVDLPQQYCAGSPTIGVTSTPVIDRTAGAHGIIYLVAMTKSRGWNLAPPPARARCDHRHRTARRPEGDHRQLSGRQRHHHLRPGTVRGARRAAAVEPHDLHHLDLTLRQQVLHRLGDRLQPDDPAADGRAQRGTQQRWHGTCNLDGRRGSGGRLRRQRVPAHGQWRLRGTLDSNGFPNQQDYANSFLKLSTSGGSLTVADYFALSNTTFESNTDMDLGSGGIMLLPDLTDAGGKTRHLAVGAGKDGNIYVVNRDAMGHFSKSGNTIPQQLTQVLGNRLSGGDLGGVWSTRPTSMVTSTSGHPATTHELPISDARLSSTPASASLTSFYPGSPVVSARHERRHRLGAPEHRPRGAVRLRRRQHGHELYDSAQAGDRDHSGRATSSSPHRSRRQGIREPRRRRRIWPAGLSAVSAGGAAAA